MEVVLLNEKISFQKNGVVIDVIGNHKNSWSDYYNCFATIGGESGREKQAAGTTVEEFDLTFTVRYCKKVAAITTTGYRVHFHGEIYDITSIDHMNYKKKALKFRCKKARR